ncbi:gamma-glutamyl-gamma-aminobutyrate hydrolase family protein [Leucobacter sp. wl10]|uniref:gamma-glutamyl-gamma-aminobutyrate hydrolase family protein n=1 Tax=Leucobacter sp. wl10 TaxID=2304677 RepID=UPI000E5A9A60|nr:gamma-glutamyl-gamma-aminobutyrate hydrolase family protein [Leucobacter sp. wl10]RGE24339.1 gamma-glutamyl-gamma-aminobutyrate hydrolase family protein [Leucobacter sp. wl10]
MTDLAVDPTPFLAVGDEDPGGPLIRMVVSLTFPGMDRRSQRLQDEFTRIAFDAVRAAGGRPRIVDSAADRLAPGDEVFEAAGGVVFLGGGDVDPDCYGYGGAPPENLYGVDRRADDHCIGLIREAAQRDLPTLAICRGSQLLNVAFGGTLIPDIENWPLHRGGRGEPLFIDEEVLLEAGSEIARIFGRTRAAVRNGHHQAVDAVGADLRGIARARDGIVEATQHRDATWMIGVQWHPEEPDADPRDRALLFGELVKRASA